MTAPDVGDLAALGALRLALRHLGHEAAREEWSARPRELVDPERRHPGRRGLDDDGELPDLRPAAALLQPLNLDAGGGQVDPSAPVEQPSRPAAPVVQLRLDLDGSTPPLGKSECRLSASHPTTASGALGAAL